MGCSTCRTNTASPHAPRSECGREDGCGTRKAEQRLLLDELIARLYPSRTWGQPDDEASFRAGFSAGELRRLAQQLAVALKAPVAVRPGGAEDLCASIYVLCLGREPPLLTVRDQGLESLAALGEPVDAGAPRRLADQYLRLSCSLIGRLVAIQEVALELEIGCGQAPEGMAVIREIPRPGVFDPKLLKRFQKAVDLVLACGYQHLDMGLLDVPAAQLGLAPGEYEARYGVAPGLFNFFFQAQPVLTASAVYLPLAQPPPRGATCPAA